MGVTAGKTNTDNTGESNGQSQYQNAGGQQAAGVNNGYTNIHYLDPNAIAGQKARYGGLLDKSQGNTDQTFGAASQFYGSLLNSPGYDTGTKNAISAIGNAAANEKLDEGKAAAERHAAATGNDAGYTAGLSNLYGMGARDTADRANQNQLAFYQEQQRQKELGGAGMERLFGTAQGAQLGLLGGMNNLSTLGSGTESGGSYANTGSQFGNGSATNQNTSHQAGQMTHTGGEGDAANGLDGLLNGLLGGGKNGGGSGGGLGGAVGDLLKNLFGGGKSTGSQMGKGLADANGNPPGSPNYDPTNVPGVNDGNPGTVDTYDPLTGQVTHSPAGEGDPGDIFGDPEFYDPYGGDYGPQFDPNYTDGGDYGPYPWEDPSYYLGDY